MQSTWCNAAFEEHRKQQPALAALPWSCVHSHEVTKTRNRSQRLASAAVVMCLFPRGDENLQAQLRQTSGCHVDTKSGSSCRKGSKLPNDTTCRRRSPEVPCRPEL